MINNVEIISGGQQRDSAIHIYLYLFSHKPPAHPGCHIKLSRIPLYIWASQVAQQERICLPSRGPEFDPWVGKNPWRRDQLPTPVFWPGEFHELYSPWGCKESDVTERLSLSPYTIGIFCPHSLLSIFPFFFLIFSKSFIYNYRLYFLLWRVALLASTYLSIISFVFLVTR